MAKGRNKSGIWNYFTKDDANNKLVCNVCLMEYKGSNSSTPLWKHLQKLHPNVLSHLPDASSTSQPQSAFPIKRKHSPKMKIYRQPEPVPEGSGPSFEPSLDDYTPAPVNPAELLKRLKRLIVCCHLPYTIVETESFGDLTYLLNSTVQLPTAEDVKNSIMEDLAAAKQEIIQMLQNAPGRISLTVDLHEWETFFKKGIYVAVSAHWITTDFDAVSVRLGFLSRTRTCEGLKEDIMELLNEFGIADRILGWTLDNTIEQLNRACTELCLEKSEDKSRVPPFTVTCVCHTLHTIVNSALAEFKPTLERARDLVRFMKDTDRKEQFRAQLREQGTIPKISWDYDDYWATTVRMLMQVYNLSDDLAVFLMSSDRPQLILPNTDLEIIRHLFEILEPLMYSITDCSEAGVPTFHLTKPCLQAVQLHLDECRNQLEAPAWFRELAARIHLAISSLDLKQANWDHNMVAICQMLDPCVKSSFCETPEQRTAALNLLKHHHGLYAPNEPASTAQSTPTSLRSKYLQQLTTNNEVDNYLGCSREPECEVLEFWKKNAGVYPGLAKMALDFLAVRAGCAVSDQLFNKKKMKEWFEIQLNSKFIRTTLCLWSWWKVLDPAEEEEEAMDE